MNDNYWASVVQGAVESGVDLSSVSVEDQQKFVEMARAATAGDVETLYARSLELRGVVSPGASWDYFAGNTAYIHQGMVSKELYENGAEALYTPALEALHLRCRLSGYLRLFLTLPATAGERAMAEACWRQVRLLEVPRYLSGQWGRFIMVGSPSYLDRLVTRMNSGPGANRSPLRNMLRIVRDAAESLTLLAGSLDVLAVHRYIATSVPGMGALWFERVEGPYAHAFHVLEMGLGSRSEVVYRSLAGIDCGAAVCDHSVGCWVHKSESLERMLESEMAPRAEVFAEGECWKRLFFGMVPTLGTWVKKRDIDHRNYIQTALTFVNGEARCRLVSPGRYHVVDPLEVPGGGLVRFDDLPDDACVGGSGEVKEGGHKDAFWDSSPRAGEDPATRALRVRDWTANVVTAHAGGHSCLHNMFFSFGVTLPHQVETLSQAVRFVGRKKWPVLVKEVGGFITRLTHTEGRHTDTHWFWNECGCCPHEQLSWLQDSVQTFYDVQSQSFDDFADYDLVSSNCRLSWGEVGCGNPKQCSRPCNELSQGRTLCTVCNFVVVEDGHAARCRQESMPVGNEDKLAAWYGDALHTLDVTRALLEQQVPVSELTATRQKYVQGKAQADWMRQHEYGDVDASDAVLATEFEAEYRVHRTGYLAEVFPAVRSDCYVTDAFANWPLSAWGKTHPWGWCYKYAYAGKDYGPWVSAGILKKNVLTDLNHPCEYVGGRRWHVVKPGRELHAGWIPLRDVPDMDLLGGEGSSAMTFLSDQALLASFARMLGVLTGEIPDDDPAVIAEVPSVQMEGPSLGVAVGQPTNVVVGTAWTGRAYCPTDLKKGVIIIPYVVEDETEVFMCVRTWSVKSINGLVIQNERWVIVKRGANGAFTASVEMVTAGKPVHFWLIEVGRTQVPCDGAHAAACAVASLLMARAKL
jgi:hypothetical protein